VVPQPGAQGAARAPLAGQFLDVDGARLHYVEFGEGPPVVPLHGSLVLLQDFIGSGLIDLLRQRYRVIAFDMPGFGYSTRPRDLLWTAQAGPPGICLDSACALSVASPPTREVVRVLPGGEISHRVPTDGDALACALGGDERRTLVVLSTALFDRS
jgi:pimeloyl-ACP methyl ester carboxylesterase